MSLLDASEQSLIGFEGNVRFKIAVNGSEVVLKLHPNQSISHHTFSTTEEGWCRSGMELSWSEGKLTLAGYREEKDCDGRMDNYFESEATRLVDGWPYWVTTTEGQRDWTAESMGY